MSSNQNNNQPAVRVVQHVETQKNKPVVKVRPVYVKLAAVNRMSVSQAVTILKNQGIAVRVIYNTSTVSNNTVLSQKPAAGTRIAKHSTVVLYVSRQTQAQHVPVRDITNLQIADAQSILKQEGLRLQITTNKGQVITTQNPPPGTFVAVGSAVRVQTSEGENQ